MLARTSDVLAGFLGRYGDDDRSRHGDGLIPRVAAALRGLGRSMGSASAPPPTEAQAEPPAALPAALEGQTSELGACLRLSQGLGSLVQRDRRSFAELSNAQSALLGELSDLVAELEAAANGEPASPPNPVAPVVPAPPAAPLSRAPAPPTPAVARAAEEGEDGSYAAYTTQKLELLRRLLARREARIEPELSPSARLGHACPDVEALFGLEPGGGFTVLEDLASLGLLQRELANRVHVCPRCRAAQLNFRELCPACDALETRVEPMVHHFRCGYVGLEKEFRQGLELVCPKCRRVAHQLGQDFDRPHETYVCEACQYLFEEPLLAGQCLACAHTFHASEAEPVRVSAYRPTPLAVRAVQQGRLTGLEVDTLLVDTELRVATRDFLEFEVRRELDRLNRYRTPFTLAILGFEADRPFPVFLDWGDEDMRTLCHLLSSSLRTLDIVARLDSFRIGMLMPETPASGAAAVRDRLHHQLGELSLVDSIGSALRPLWLARTWSEPGTTLEEVRAMLGEEGA